MNRHTVCLGLGSNLGARAETLRSAIEHLERVEGVRLERVSSFRETSPIGGPNGQGPYLNAAAKLVVDQEPAEILRICREIERKFGRTRELRWGPRTLDMDILLFGDLMIGRPDLIVPHPRMALRRFVLGPLSEIAGDAVDPRTGRTVAELSANLDRRPRLVRIGRSWPAEIREEVLSRLKNEMNALIARGDRPPSLREIEPSRWIAFVEGEEPFPGWFQGGSRSAVEPTFAATKGSAADLSRDPIPVLRIESDRPETIAAEIVAACAGCVG